MSGGHFNYDQYRMSSIEDSIIQLILDNNINEYYQFSEDTIAEFRKAINYLHLANIYANRIDWLVSGDDSEEAFHKRLNTELLQYENGKT